MYCSIASSAFFGRCLKRMGELVSEMPEVLGELVSEMS